MSKIYMANTSSLSENGSTELEFSLSLIHDKEKSWFSSEDVDGEVEE